MAVSRSSVLHVPTDPVAESQPSVMRVILTQQNTEWDAAESDDDDGGGVMRITSQAYDARERRLTQNMLELEKEAALGDVDVEVIVQEKEWFGDAAIADDDEKEGKDAVLQCASQTYEARERRLTVAIEKLRSEQPVGDADVEVLTHSTEWSGSGVESDEDGHLDHHAMEAYMAREKRLSLSVAALSVQAPLGDTEVVVVKHDMEWEGEPNFDDDEETVAESARRMRHAALLFEAREKRLSIGVQSLDRNETYGDKEVDIVLLTEEWDGGHDSDEDRPPVKESARLQKCASEINENREKRLSVTMATLSKGEMLGDVEVTVSEQGAEWADAAAVEDSDTPDDEPVEVGRRMSKAVTGRASDMYAAREVRLSIAQQTMAQEAISGDAQIEIQPERREWSAMDGQDSDEGELEDEEHFQRIATQRLAAREKRHSVAASLGEHQRISDFEVPVIQSKEEWVDGDNSDEDDEVPFAAKHSQCLSDVYAARERRLSVAVETLEQANPIGDVQVVVVPQVTEWFAIMDSDDDENDGHSTYTTTLYSARSLRHTYTAQVLEKEQAIPDTEVEVVKSTKEWMSDKAGSGDDAEDDGTTEAMQRFMSEKANSRERSLSRRSILQKLSVPLADAEIEVQPTEREWAEEVPRDSDDSEGEDKQAVLLKRASASFTNREQRLTVAAEVIATGNSEAHGRCKRKCWPCVSTY
mmetsp:Transcript_99616/g.281126  ORF Transcript_99616/g.281126 Transcript_99616/m.281126 type:complete len:699 (-) Transcript_99616:114-2210(-)